MRKLICDLCRKESGTLYNVEVAQRVEIVALGHKTITENLEVCWGCEYEIKLEKAKSEIRAINKLKKQFEILNKPKACCDKLKRGENK